MGHLLALISLLFALTHAGEFIDDYFVRHQIPAGSTFVMQASVAMGMHNFGIPNEQVLGTYGNIGTSGSDFDPKNPDIDTAFTSDPTPEEYAFIQTTRNLSPDCGNEYCTSFDLDGFIELAPDYIIMEGYRESPWGISAYVQNITDAMGGKPIIYIELSQTGQVDCTEGNTKLCYGKSMIEVINQYHDLARAMEFDMLPSVEDDRKALCEAAENFSENMEKAHAKGIRVMAGYLTNSVSYFATPIDDMVLRMFEELGMPLLHVGSCEDEGCQYEYFWEWIPKESYFRGCPADAIVEGCNDDPLYPVDFWLYDHRTTLSVTEPEAINLIFPDKAIIKKQYASWPIGGGKITQRHATEILNLVGPAVAAAERIYPDTTCVAADVSGSEHKTAGLAGGEHPCYDETYHNDEYKTCSSSEEQSFNVCFSGNSMVQVEGQGAIPISQLSIGDSVKTENGAYEQVYSLAHKNEKANAEFLRIFTDQTIKPLEISDHHMVLKANGESVPSKTIVPGDFLLHESGSHARVTKVTRTTSVGQYAPFTMSGKIVVDGIISSTFVSLQGTSNLMIGNIDTGLSHQFIAQSFSAPHRALCRVFMNVCKDGETQNDHGISNTVAWYKYFADSMLNMHPFFLALSLAMLSPVLSLFIAIEWVVTDPIGAGLAMFFTSAVVVLGSSSANRKLA